MDSAHPGRAGHGPWLHRGHGQVPGAASGTLVGLAPTAQYPLIGTEEDQAVMINQKAIGVFQHIGDTLGIRKLGTAPARGRQIAELDAVAIVETHLTTQRIAAIAATYPTIGPHAEVGRLEH